MKLYLTIGFTIKVFVGSPGLVVFFARNMLNVSSLLFQSLIFIVASVVVIVRRLLSSEGFLRRLRNEDDR